MSSSSVKFTVKRNDVSGNSVPNCFVCLPPLWNVDTKTFFTVAGWVGSSQETGTVVFIKSAESDSPDVWEISFPPRSALIICSDVDLPLDGLPIVIGTEQEPKRLIRGSQLHVSQLLLFKQRIGNGTPYCSKKLTPTFTVGSSKPAKFKWQNITENSGFSFVQLSILYTPILRSPRKYSW